MDKKLWEYILQVKTKAPLVQNITNFVVMNNTANALLAVGASPIMAHAHGELEEMANICQSLVVNIGTADDYWSDSMIKAAGTASALKKPWLLDPVGAGATSYRDSLLRELLKYRPSVIRGNASEILALAKHNLSRTKGVDSTASSNEAVEAGRYLNESVGAIVCISGATDIVIDGKREYHISNGDPLMTRVTGLGCSSSAVLGAFIAVADDFAAATVAGTALFSVAGELAAKSSAGPGSLQVALLDKLFSITESEFKHTLKLEIK